MYASQTAEILDLRGIIARLLCRMPPRTAAHAVEDDDDLAKAWLAAVDWRPGKGAAVPGETWCEFVYSYMEPGAQEKLQGFAQ